MSHTSDKPKTIVVIASGGGHWIQLTRLRAAIDDCKIIFVTTLAGYREQVSPNQFYVVRDASRWDKIGLLIQAFQIYWILIRNRPDAVITTGAAPGYFAIRIGKWLGARTVWIDSIANAEELSLSGRKAGKHVDLWLTQWPHLAKRDGPYYFGAVL